MANCWLFSVPSLALALLLLAVLRDAGHSHCSSAGWQTSRPPARPQGMECLANQNRVPRCCYSGYGLQPHAAPALQSCCCCDDDYCFYSDHHCLVLWGAWIWPVHSALSNPSQSYLLGLSRAAVIHNSPKLAVSHASNPSGCAFQQA